MLEALAQREETTMTEQWVPEAIAQQEEYIKRRKSCSPERWVDAPHSWDRFSLYPKGPTYEACLNCRVTKTDEDYQIKIGDTQIP